MASSVKSVKTFLACSNKSESEVKSGFFLNVVVGESAVILKLFSSEYESLFIRRGAFLVLNLGFDTVNAVRSLNIESDSLACKGLDEDFEN